MSAAQIGCGYDSATQQQLTPVSTNRGSREATVSSTAFVCLRFVNLL
jgi:hypothetical protein